MGILVVGSVALDDVTTPAGSRRRTLGGACTYFSTAASLYDDVSVVGVVGEDFPPEHVEFLRSRAIDLRGLQVAPGRTFFWAGSYGEDLDEAQTLETQLNVFGSFHPVIPDDLRDSEYVFLANIHPELQIEVLEQMRSPTLTALDSMNFWIMSSKEVLTRAISMVDVVLLNEAEVRLYAGETNTLRAAQAILELGPTAVVVKRGQYGSALVTRGDRLGERLFVLPAYPVATVVDPTGAGDTFAAGFMGHLARTGDLTVGGLRRAVAVGTIVASFTVEDFSIDRFRTLRREEIAERYDEFRRITHYDPLGCEEAGTYAHGLRPSGSRVSQAPGQATEPQERSSGE